MKVIVAESYGSLRLTIADVGHVDGQEETQMTEAEFDQMFTAGEVTFVKGDRFTGVLIESFSQGITYELAVGGELIMQSFGGCMRLSVA